MTFLFSLKSFWKKHICADMPPELDDENNYGRFLDRAAKMTNYHPTLLAGIMKQAECFGQRFQTPDDRSR
jgi:hypothetical protein